jgi:hypothetical protein
MLTQARLKEVLHYDPETGVWTPLTSKLNKWYAQSQYEGKKYHLGCFITIKEASAAYKLFVDHYHREFART